MGLAYKVIKLRLLGKKLLQNLINQVWDVTVRGDCLSCGASNHSKDNGGKNLNNLISLSGLLQNFIVKHAETITI